MPFAVGDRVWATFPQSLDEPAMPLAGVVIEVLRLSEPAYRVQFERDGSMVDVWERALEKRITFREFI